MQLKAQRNFYQLPRTNREVFYTSVFHLLKYAYVILPANPDKKLPKHDLLDRVASQWAVFNVDKSRDFDKLLPPNITKLGTAQQLIFILHKTFKNPDKPWGRLADAFIAQNYVLICSLLKDIPENDLAILINESADYSKLTLKSSVQNDNEENIDKYGRDYEMPELVDADDLQEDDINTQENVQENVEEDDMTYFYVDHEKKTFYEIKVPNNDVKAIDGAYVYKTSEADIECYSWIISLILKTRYHNDVESSQILQTCICCITNCLNEYLEKSFPKSGWIPNIYEDYNLLLVAEPMFNRQMIGNVMMNTEEYKFGKEFIKKYKNELGGILKMYYESIKIVTQEKWSFNGIKLN